MQYSHQCSSASRMSNFPLFSQFYLNWLDVSSFIFSFSKNTLNFFSFCILKHYLLSCRRKITLQIFCHYVLTSQVLLWFKNGPWTSSCGNVLFVGCWILCLVEWKITRYHNTVRNITTRYFELPWCCPFVLPQSETMFFLYCLGCLQYCVLKIRANTGPVVTQFEHTFEAMYGRSKSWEA